MDPLPEHSNEASPEQVKKLYTQRDRVVKAMTADGFFRLAAVRNTKTARSAQERHYLSPLAAVLLGRAMAGASLLASFLKNEERIILDFNGNGPAQRVYAESLQLGEVRGYVQNPQCVLDFSQGKTMLGDGLGIGLLRVVRILYNQYEPITGIVELFAGDISTDLAYYLTQSEQIPTAVMLDVSINPEGNVEQSGGLIVQAMPGASEQSVRAMYEGLKQLNHLTDLLASGYSPQEILKIVAAAELVETADTPIDFFCRCSLERFKAALITLGMKEVKAMRDNNQRELVCRYCNTRYHLSDADFEDILGSLQAKNN
ncbi:MAG: Hsp33 family molecular chaperone HslO [Bacteroidota bacterium]|nr:Hsp33 family molecular chaperone HslO [Candidatus Kapabacteria bacterium]MDW8219739.1 Hsp33 family molecular chaperone HslO [Bacteroidota bacterium]